MISTGSWGPGRPTSACCAIRCRARRRSGRSIDGRANFVELAVAGPAGKIEGGALRLFNPQSRQWSLNFANLRNGLLTAPVYGSFDVGGKGLFYGQDMLDGRAIMVRFIITRSSKSRAHFEQAYSADGGATWETNWIAEDSLR